MTTEDDTPIVSASRGLDAWMLRRWAVAARAALAANRDSIDGLNVFPVPDADTGTNMFLTLDAAVEATLDARPTADSAPDIVGELDRFARATLLGARGNSGVIVSQLVRGLVDGLRSVPPGRGGADPRAVAEAFRSAAEAGYAAVTQPEEGTILTVAQTAADAASRAAGADGSLLDVVTAAAEGARAALDATTGQLGALAQAGVVDAGGAGLVVVLDALCTVVAGGGEPVAALPRHGPLVPAANCADVTPDYTGPRFEVMLVLDDTDADALSRARAALGELGDSLLLVGGGSHGRGPWRLHVHTDDVDAVLAAATAAGHASDIAVTDLHEQTHRGHRPTTDASPEVPGDEPMATPRPASMAAAARPAPSSATRRPTAVIACATARGVVAALTEAGARVVRPTRVAVVEAVEDARAVDASCRVVALVPAELRERVADTTRDVDVLVAETDAHLVAAAAVLAPEDDDVADELRATLMGVRACVVTTADMPRLPARLGEVLDDDTALVTVVIGRQAEAARDDALRDIDSLVRHLAPDAEVSLVNGGAPGYALTIGAER